MSADRPPPTHNVSYAPTTRVTARPNVPAQRKPAVKISPEQRASMQAAAKTKQRDLSTELQQWHKDTLAFAARLAQKFGNKPGHYLQLMFSGASEAQKDRKPNAYNAWSHHIAKEVNEAAVPGEAERLIDIQRDNIDKYHALTDQQKEDLIKELEEQRDTRKFGTRLTQKARANDLQHCMAQMQNLAFALKNRVGVDGFFCFVTNTAEFSAKSQWYFTDPRIEDYLKVVVRKGWDTETVGVMLEAFAMAGCDFNALKMSSKDRAEHLKSEIREKIHTMLVDITNNDGAIMNYVNHEGGVVLKYGVELVGWPKDRVAFKNPSSLTTSLSTLRHLLEEIDEKRCLFKCIPTAELKQRQEAYDKKLKDGEVARRKERSDAGKKRGKKGKKAVPNNASDEEMSPDEGNPRPEKRPRQEASGAAGGPPIPAALHPGPSPSA